MGKSTSEMWECEGCLEQFKEWHTVCPKCGQHPLYPVVRETKSLTKPEKPYRKGKDNEK